MLNAVLKLEGAEIAISSLPEGMGLVDDVQAGAAKGRQDSFDQFVMSGLKVLDAAEDKFEDAEIVGGERLVVAN